MASAAGADLQRGDKGEAGAARASRLIRVRVYAVAPRDAARDAAAVAGRRGRGHDGRQSRGGDESAVCAAAADLRGVEGAAVWARAAVSLLCAAVLCPHMDYFAPQGPIGITLCCRALSPQGLLCPTGSHRDYSALPCSVPTVMSPQGRSIIINETGARKTDGVARGRRRHRQRSAAPSRRPCRGPPRRTRT
jgi:hypothetical protein